DDPSPTDVLVRVDDRAAVYTLDHHPFDVVGWDGHLYPYAFSIHDFEPISGRQHQPPPVHQTFELDGAVVCSFCPRRLDDGPDVVTAPYNHANLDSDEVLYYVSGSFFSGRGLGVSDLVLEKDATAASSSATTELATAIDAWDGPGVLVLAGNLFELVASPAVDTAHALAAHPKLSAAVAAFRDCEGRRVIC